MRSADRCDYCTTPCAQRHLLLRGPTSALQRSAPIGACLLVGSAIVPPPPAPSGTCPSVDLRVLYSPLRPLAPAPPRRPRDSFTVLSATSSRLLVDPATTAPSLIRPRQTTLLVPAVPSPHAQAHSNVTPSQSLTPQMTVTFTMMIHPRPRVPPPPLDSTRTWARGS